MSLKLSPRVDEYRLPPGGGGQEAGDEKGTNQRKNLLTALRCGEMRRVLLHGIS